MSSSKDTLSHEPRKGPSLNIVSDQIMTIETVTGSLSQPLLYKICLSVQSTTRASQPPWVFHQPFVSSMQSYSNHYPQLAHALCCPTNKLLPSSLNRIISSPVMRIPKGKATSDLIVYTCTGLITLSPGVSHDLSN